MNSGGCQFLTRQTLVTDETKFVPGRRPALRTRRGTGVSLAERVRAIRPPSRSAQTRHQTGSRHEPPRLVFAVAGDVIRQADRRHPADALLRQALQAQRRLGQDFRAQVSRAVFAYYRWRGWLDSDGPMAHQIRRALELAEQFANRPGSFSDEELVKRAAPAWVREKMDVVPAWVRAIQAEPQLWLRARRGQGRALAEKLGTTWKSSLPDAVLYEGDEDLFRTPEFHAGDFEIQDVSSQAVGLLCDPKPGETWWDACAGEGGKTLHLADLMQNQGLIWATDRAEWRLKRLKRRAARAGVFNLRAKVWDGGPKLPTKTGFAGVLVDAPCSGIGTWQRNPQARWTTTPADVSELAAVQKDLLAHVASTVNPGGRLVYAVCTLTRAETVELAAAFGREFPEFGAVALRNPFNRGEPALQPRWFWPQDCGGNGMFVAMWRRKR